MDFVASAIAVWKPKLWSMKGMSLSMVLGTPTTPMRCPRDLISAAIRWAPRMVPSPPMTNRIEMPMRSSASTISTLSLIHI